MNDVFKNWKWFVFLPLKTQSSQCQTIQKVGHLYKFSTKPYVPNRIKKLELVDCVLDSAHFKEFDDLFPNLEELTIDFTRRGHGEEYAFDTGKSLSEAFIFASTNSQNYDRLFIELQVQYMKIPISNLGRTCCVQKLFLIFSTIFVHNMFCKKKSF